MKKFIISILNKIQDKELEKPLDKVNTDLILRCSKLILKLKGIDATLSEEEIENRVAKIFPKNK